MSSLYGAGTRDPLGPQHLLDLQQHRVAVLEDGAGVRPHLHAPPLLLRDDTRPEALPHLLVLRQPKDLAALDRLHGPSLSVFGNTNPKVDLIRTVPFRFSI